MKIKFDESISRRIIDAIRVLDRDPAIEIGSVHQDYGEGQPDPDWMFRFRSEGGIAMISGDHQILQNPVNLAAYRASGLISIWPPPAYPHLRRFGQAAFIIRWWPAIKMKIETSNPGDRWRLPLMFSPAQEAFKAISDPRTDGRA